MVFKRRNPRSWAQMAQELVYPKGGFKRATQYLVHRMRRLPDEPHRIARGVFVGVFVNFPPIFGIQFATAALLAWLVRGNILAAVLCTFLSNPITTPWIAVGSLALGHWMLGIEAPLDFVTIYAAFVNAGGEIWANAKAIFTDDVTHWDRLLEFFHTIYWPYLVGSLIPGLIAAVASYYLTLPVIRTYQRLRAHKTRERIERRRVLLRPRAHDPLAHPAPADDDATPPASGDDEGRSYP